MDNFEKRLASLPLARPSAGLRQRIFGDMSNTSPEVSWFRSFFRRGVSVGRAACIAVAASLAAAMLVHSFNRPGDSMSVTPSEQNITIH
ncbi:MAG TPA: hypothetical protein VLH60_04700, partial [Sedimentisphaerales bacterium]|nr:hypothetical protein [Sedimentisphaerales bacterium]